jgi:pimeloyl-ACP methyl ester carboxylesterase
MTELPQKGLRCIFYDRRGFGKSDRPSEGYDYDTLAGDLKSLMDELNLSDVTLVGFSMGGGEVARYFSLYDGERVSKVVLISTVVPYMLKTEDNPNGVAQMEFEGMAKKMKEDRPAFFENFAKAFFGVSLVSHPVSDAFLANNLTRVMDASPIATLECANSFATTDFRNDVVKINVPTLIIHGDKDNIVPIDATGNESAKMIKGSKYIVYEGAPHGLWYTEKDKLNRDLIDFI